VVHKKVVAQKVQTAKVSTNQTVRIAKTNQAARLEKKTTAVKADMAQAKAKKQAVTKTKTGRQTLVAKKTEVIPARDTVTKRAKPKKTTVRPKSDISKIKQPATDNSAISSDKLIAATSNVTPKLAAIPRTYNAIGKIDPFEPLFREKAVSVMKKKGKKRIPRTPLERIDLSQLKLVGIILASSGNRALVEESSGKGYVIKKGTYIGVNSGKVVKIKKEKVVVEEEFEDVFGKSKLRQREIKLPKPPGEF
jgi:type IV pilus assembly protein PilP